MTDRDDAPVVGIDLGTTNSLVAHWVDGAPQIVRDAGGHPVHVPSAVSYLPDGTYVVGQAAVERAAMAPAETVLSVKRLMGQGLADLRPEVRGHFACELVEVDRQRVDVKVGEATYSPQEVSAQILGELKRRTEAVLGPVQDAVITVPAYFDDSQRQATRTAGKLAGWNVLRIINEPTAASLAYGLGDKHTDGVIAVYDLGGGTFDLSLLRVQAGTFRVLATCGDTFLGGDDVDRLLVDVALKSLAEKGLPTADPRLKARLRAAAERAKIALSTEATTVMRLREPTLGVNLELELSRADLHTLMDPLLERTLELCQQALTTAELTVEQVDELVLVGGSTRTPYVHERVGAFFGRAPHVGLDPDQVVAQGAAAQAGILAGHTSDLLLLDVIPLSLGIETYGGGVTKLIMANSAIPTQTTEEYSTPKDNVTAIDLHVLQGERELVADCRSLARFKLRIPPMPAGMPQVEVTFLVDADGILHVSALEKRSGAEASIEVTPVHGLTEEEIDTIMADSITHALEDVRVHQLIDLRNESATVIRATQRTLKAEGAKLTPEQRTAITEAAATLEALCKHEDNQAIKAALEELNKQAEPLAELVLNRVAQDSLSGKRLDEIEVS
ncbi:MAG: Fe-S protein assembly chaperone HscA [Planctomycetes bacterium]|nr:Fe-S protein assembly chaperone HscA [Planctomycetota bacterium]